MNIPSIDGAHYSRATSRVNKKKKGDDADEKPCHRYSNYSDISRHFRLNVSRITRCLSFPRDTDNETSSRLQRRFLESRDTKGPKSANSTNVDVFLFSSRYKRERERLKRRRRGPFIRVSTGETILEIPAGPRSSKANNRALHF